jgi:hypothetical protein
MSFNRLLTYTCLALIAPMLLGALIACECVDQKYRTAPCDIYNIVNDSTLEFVEQRWVQENCGCDDLLERFELMSQDPSTCIVCEHPYEKCPAYSSCN